MSDKLKYSGKKYWRSLAQSADTAKSTEALHSEFPEHAWEKDNSISRRNFLSLMGASLALAGLAGCRRPVDKIVPYVNQPEEITPGVARHYATTMPFGLSAYGLVVECHEGRPTKIEGNPAHPSTLGAANAMVQASILGLYDPDRSKRIKYRGNEQDWTSLVSFWRDLFSRYQQNQGRGLAVLTESFSSPTLAAMATAFRNQFPQARFVAYEPVSDENVYDGIKMATGAVYCPSYHFDKARVILSLDSDFLQTESEGIVAARGFADGRRLQSENDTMNRLYAIESNFSLTGGMADHRLYLASRHIGPFVLALAQELKQLGLPLKIEAASGYPDNFFDKKWLQVVAGDLIQSKGSGLVVAGRRQPPIVHALVLYINQALGNIGNTLAYHRPIDTELPSDGAFASLTEDMRNGEISTLVILGGNPVYAAPADLNFAESLKKVEHTIHLSLHHDETSQMTEWHIPQVHYLESWGDARAADGTISIMQPMIEPLYGGHSALEVLNLLVSGRDQRGYDITRERWKEILRGKAFEKEWQGILHDGFLPGSSSTKEVLTCNPDVINIELQRILPAMKKPNVDNLEIIFASSPALFDGRFANNGWLQELPDAITKITWDNPTLISPRTAKELNLENGDMVKLEYRGQTIEVPIWIVPGQADYSAVLTLGYGREAAGKVGDNVGFNTYRLRTSSARDFGDGLKMRKTGQKYELAVTQEHQSMEGRPLVREATLEEYRRQPDFAARMVEHPPIESIFTEHKYDQGYQWGMAIDLNACTGCNACTIACQSENNIPIVGKEQVARGREMHWIRNDRYFVGDIDSPEMVHQPIACQHCENAPCETVCPVAATVHDREGLNVMTYNRCIGTRYCSNNCPYEVRRFNFFNYTSKLSETIKMAQNPEVTVRSRGVMEKCTFCVQRINHAKGGAKLESRDVRDGEIVTACQQTCPARAIVFGNINDPESEVARIKKQNRNYQILDEFNTRPRNSYLARIRNPHPELENYKPVTG
jgi:MoCo/4Fe-4S cofactor protein with predicted Tat translocation signal